MDQGGYLPSQTPGKKVPKKHKHFHIKVSAGLCMVVECWEVGGGRWEVGVVDWSVVEWTGLVVGSHFSVVLWHRGLWQGERGPGGWRGDSTIYNNHTTQDQQLPPARPSGPTISFTWPHQSYQS